MGWFVLAYEFLKTKIQEILTDLEFNVIKEYSKDKSYKEIAKALDTHTKSVDNALQRARNKLQEFLDENNIWISLVLSWIHFYLRLELF